MPEAYEGAQEGWMVVIIIRLYISPSDEELCIEI